MDTKKRGLFIGVIIIVVGLLSLLASLDLIPLGDEVFWAGLFLLFSYGACQAYRKDRTKWWALLVAAICLFLAIVFVLEALPFFPHDLVGPIFLWMIAAVFIMVFVRNQQHWWAILPAGFFIVLGVIVFVDEFHLLNNDYIPFLLFLGVGLTFGFLYGIRDEKNRLKWAKYPAVFVTLFSFFLLAVIETSALTEWFLPAGFIIVGGIMIYRALCRNKKSA